MNIAVFGMGYVGCVTAACLIKQGHNVIGVDIIQSKVDDLNRGNWPIYEPGLDDLNTPESMKELFSATCDDKKAVHNSEVLLICVGTPSRPDGEVDLSYLKAVVDKIATYVKRHPRNYFIMVRSTVPFGTTRALVYNKFKNIGAQVEICFVPEFLREGNAVNDYYAPSLKVVGCEKEFPVNSLDTIFSDMKGEWHVTSFEIAESIKYISNSWHALKIVFTNEIATILKEYNLDAEQATDLFCQDKILNISASYMRPGFAYGGSCLAKELKALLALAKAESVKTPLLDAISESNNELIKRLELLIYGQKSNNIGFCGVSFKPNTDDIRNSPIVVVIKNLISGKRSYQGEFNIAILDNQGASKNFSREAGPEIDVVTNMDELMEVSDVIVLGPYKISDDLVVRMLGKNKVIIDLKWHSMDENIKTHPNYHTLV